MIMKTQINLKSVTLKHESTNLIAQKNQSFTRTLKVLCSKFMTRFERDRYRCELDHPCGGTDNPGIDYPLTAAYKIPYLRVRFWGSVCSIQPRVELRLKWPRYSVSTLEIHMYIHRRFLKLNCPTEDKHI